MIKFIGRLATAGFVASLALVLSCQAQLGGIENAFISCTDDESCPGELKCNTAGLCTDPSVNAAPSVVIRSVSRSLDVVEIKFDLFDLEGDSVTLNAKLIDPAQSTSEDAQELVLEGEPQNGWRGSAQGTKYTARWDAALYFGDTDLHPDLVLTLLASDGVNTGTTASSTPFVFGNTLPTTETLTIDNAGSKIDNLIIFRLSVEDSSADRIDVVALSVEGEDSEGAALRFDIPVPETELKTESFPVAGLKNLSSEMGGGESHPIVWNSSAGPTADLDIHNVVFTLTIKEVLFDEETIEVQTNYPGLLLDNGNGAPTVAFETNFSDLLEDNAVSGLFSVNFSLVDPDFDRCDIVAEVFDPRINGGEGAWLQASAALGNFPPGSHTFEWSSTQLGATALYGVKLRLSATDSQLAQSEINESPAFDVDNADFSGNAPPNGIIESVQRTTGISVVSVLLVDAESDPLIITPTFKDGGAGAQTAVILGAAPSYASSPSGVRHTLDWDAAASLLDLNSVLYRDLQFLVEIDDGNRDVGESNPVIETAAIPDTVIMGNTGPQISDVAIDVASGPNHIRDNAIVRFSVSDESSDPINLRRFEFEDGVDTNTWISIANGTVISTGAGLAIPVGNVVQLPTNAGTTEYSFVWDTTFSGVPVDRTIGRVRLVVEDWVAGEASTQSSETDGISVANYQLRNNNFPPELIGAPGYSVVPTLSQSNAPLLDDYLELTLKLRDLDSDNLSLRIQYHRLSDPTQIDITANTALSNIPSVEDAVGSGFNLNWDTRQLGPGSYDDLVLTIQVFDSVDRGTPLPAVSEVSLSVASTLTIVSGNAPPNAIIKGVDDTDGHIRPLEFANVSYLLSDANGDGLPSPAGHSASVSLLYQTDCSAPPVTSSTRPNESSSPSGIEHSFLNWKPSIATQVLSDVNGVDHDVLPPTDLCFNFETVDVLGANFDAPFSSIYHLGNDVPSLQVNNDQFSTRPFCGAVPIFLFASDADNDAIDIEVEYRRVGDANSLWRGTSYAATNIPTSTESIVYGVLWPATAIATEDFDTDGMGDPVATPFEIRVRAIENLGAGLRFPSSWSSPMELANFDTPYVEPVGLGFACSSGF